MSYSSYYKKSCVHELSLLASEDHQVVDSFLLHNRYMYVW